MSAALFSTAAEWLKKRGLKKMLGPFNPSFGEEYGMLVDGFESSPYLMMAHNPPYYVGLYESSGFKKAIDWYAYLMKVPEKLPSAVVAAAEFSKKKFPGLVVRTVNMDDPEGETTAFMDIYNSAWSENWGFIPLTREEVKSIVEKLKPIADPNIIVFAEVQGKPAGMLVFLPNYNEVLKRLNGRLFPFGIFKFLYYSRRIKSARLYAMGVKKEFRMGGIEAALYVEAMKRGGRSGYGEFESSLILEDNVMTRREADFFEGRQYKTYRIYEKEI